MSSAHEQQSPGYWNSLTSCRVRRVLGLVRCVPAFFALSPAAQVAHVGFDLPDREIERAKDEEQPGNNADDTDDYRVAVVVAWSGGYRHVLNARIKIHLIIDTAGWAVRFIRIP